MKRMFAFGMPIALVAVLALWSCSDDSGPTSTSIDLPSSTAQTRETTTGLSWPPSGLAKALNSDPNEEFNCTNVGEVFVRFSDPGFVDENLVGLYVNYSGMPAGLKTLRVWWDYENAPTTWLDTILGDVSAHEGVMEHAYDRITQDTKIKVRVEVIIADKTGNCARNRYVTVGPGTKVEASGSATGFATARLNGRGTKDLVFVFVPAGTDLPDVTAYRNYCTSRGFAPNANNQAIPGADVDATNYYCDSFCCFLGLGNRMNSFITNFQNFGLPTGTSLQVMDRGCGTWCTGNYANDLNTTDGLNVSGPNTYTFNTNQFGVQNYCSAKTTTFAQDGVVVCQQP